MVPVGRLVTIPLIPTRMEGFFMLSIEILRTENGFSIAELTKISGIAKQTYYNVLAGNPVSESTLQSLSKALNAPYLPGLLNLDRLYLSGIKIKKIQFPDYIPKHIQRMLLKQHPIFQ